MLSLQEVREFVVILLLVVRRDSSVGKVTEWKTRIISLAAKIISITTVASRSAAATHKRSTTGISYLDKAFRS
jgi:hypothetical protein